MHRVLSKVVHTVETDEDVIDLSISQVAVMAVRSGDEVPPLAGSRAVVQGGLMKVFASGAGRQQRILLGLLVGLGLAGCSKPGNYNPVGPSAITPATEMASHAGGTNRHYRAAITPTSVASGSSTSLALTITNCNEAACPGNPTSANQQIGSVEIIVPAGFTVTLGAVPRVPREARPGPRARQRRDSPRRNRGKSAPRGGGIGDGHVQRLGAFRVRQLQLGHQRVSRPSQRRRAGQEHAVRADRVAAAGRSHRLQRSRAAHWVRGIGRTPPRRGRSGR